MEECEHARDRVCEREQRRAGLRVVENFRSRRRGVYGARLWERSTALNRAEVDVGEEASVPRLCTGSNGLVEGAYCR